MVSSQKIESSQKSLADRIKDFNGNEGDIRRALKNLPSEIIEPGDIELSARLSDKKIEICPNSINGKVASVFVLPKYTDYNHPIIVNNEIGLTRFFNKTGEMIVIYYQRKLYDKTKWI